MADASNKTLEFPDNAMAALLFGTNNENLSYLEKELSISINDRGNQLSLSGDSAAVAQAEKVLNDLWKGISKDEPVKTADIDAKLRFLHNGKAMSKNDKIIIETKKKKIRPRSPNQAVYLGLMRDYEMVFGLGPAGTGNEGRARSARLRFSRPGAGVAGWM